MVRSLLFYFLIGSTLVMVVTDKQADIAILRTLGATPGSIMLVFIHFLSPDVYYISKLPSQLEWTDVTRITGVAFLMSMLATLYPAWRASRTQPAEALRYE